MNQKLSARRSLKSASKKPVQKWYKYEHGNSYYYSYTPNTFYERSIVGDGSKRATPKEALDHLNSIAPGDENGAGINEDGVYLQNKERPSSICVLPSGTYVHKPEQYPYPERLVPIDFRTDTYIEMDNITDKITADITNFLDNESIYRELKICYKTALLLFGPGGTGKTALIRHIVATRLPKDSVVISIASSLPSNEMLSSIKETLKDRLKIFILEEFSHFVKDRFDCEEILTFLDGEASVDKSITFATTNYPEILPANIVSRHSRIEFMHRIDYGGEAARKKLLEYYLKREVTPEELKLTDKLVADSIKALCLLTYTKKLSLVDAKKEVDNHLKLAKDNFKAKEMKIGI